MNEDKKNVLFDGSDIRYLFDMQYEKLRYLLYRRRLTSTQPTPSHYQNFKCY